jgi:2-polyprenyl-3-methyl-5-hydroxy-6-metoxy-1,4-benzoquinol methylase
LLDVSRYAVDIDPSNPNTSHAQVLDLVGASNRVLDVGCAGGDFGLALMDQGCKVTGVEIDTADAEAAAKVLDAVVVADLDRSSLSDLFDGATFDVIVFADVLEHLHDPVAVLKDSLRLLTPEGRIVISVPNVAHGSLRLAHLQGRWDLTDTGLLDRTHIRFFNRERLLDLLEDAGLVLEELRGTTADPLNVEVEVAGADLPSQVVEWVRKQPDALVYQFQLSARPRRGEEPVGRRIPLQEATPADDVRIRDEHTEAFENEGRQLLAERDHVIGLQAEIATLTWRLRDVRRKKDERISNLKREVAMLQARPLRRRLRRKAGAIKRRLRA